MEKKGIITLINTKCKKLDRTKPIRVREKRLDDVRLVKVRYDFFCFGGSDAHDGGQCLPMLRQFLEIQG